MIMNIQGRELKLGQKVMIYRNLHKNLFSIIDFKTRKLLAHGDDFTLTNVFTKVSKIGQKRVRDTKRKKVHAYVVGNFNGENRLQFSEWIAIHYDPYRFDTFVKSDTFEAVYESKCAYLLNCKCFFLK